MDNPARARRRGRAPRGRTRKPPLHADRAGAGPPAEGPPPDVRVRPRQPGGVVRSRTGRDGPEERPRRIPPRRPRDPGTPPLGVEAEAPVVLHERGRLRVEGPAPEPAPVLDHRGGAEVPRDRGPRARENPGTSVVPRRVQRDDVGPGGDPPHRAGGPDSALLPGGGKI